jgi:putative ATP-dependent endonuclease of OLD family
VRKSEVSCHDDRELPEGPIQRLRKMRLDEVALSGFRGYRNEIVVPIHEQTTTLIGRNDAGKSSLFEALEVFFGGSKLELTDFTVDSESPVSISCTFSDLPSLVTIDVDRSTTLADEYLLDATGRLTITKTWTRSKLTAPVMSAQVVHPVFEDGTDLLNAKLPALKALATQLDVPAADVDDRRTSSAYRHAIWKRALGEGLAQLEESTVPLTSEDGKSVGVSLGNYMPVFHLFRADRPGTEADQLAQDPARAVIKAVLEEHQEQLEALSKTVQREVGELLADVVTRLGEVAPELAATLTATDPSPVWSKAFSGLQFIDENGVPLSKRGSGTRRLVLLSFFRATAEKGLDFDDDGDNHYRRGVITAVEEPETALHADLQTDIVAALQDVGDLPHRQVLLTTHSSNLIRLVPAQSIRYITGEKPSRICVSVGPDGDATELLAQLNKSLGIFTDHNVRCFILIEGRNDVVGLKNLTDAFALTPSYGVRSMASLEEDGVIAFMPIGGGGNASLWASNLSPFRRDEVHIMDSDRTSEGSGLKPEMKTLISRADKKRHVYVLDRRELENYLTDEAIVSEYSGTEGFQSLYVKLKQSRGDWDYQDVPSLCAEVVHSLDPSAVLAWDKLDLGKKKEKGSRAKKTLAKAFSHPSVARSIAEDGCDLFLALKKVSDLAS